MLKFHQHLLNFTFSNFNSHLHMQCNDWHVLLPPVQNILGFCKQSTLLINYQVSPPEIHLFPYINTEYPSSSFFRTSFILPFQYSRFLPEICWFPPCTVQAICIVWLGFLWQVQFNLSLSYLQISNNRANTIVYAASVLNSQTISS
jgi:hypothetical protein